MTTTSLYFGGQPPKWAAGTWAQDAFALCPASNHVYRRTGSTGSSTTTPSADPSNWALIGAGAVRSIQRVDMLIASGSDTATATISSVVIGKTKIKHLGSYTTTGGPYATENLMSVPELTNSTTLTARRFGSGGPALRSVFEIEETW